MEVLSPDMFRLLSTFLAAQDLLRVSATCKSLRAQIFENNKLWRFHFLQRFPDTPASGVSEYDLDWRYLSLSKAPVAVDHCIRGFFLSKRLAAPIQNRQYLGFFCRVTTGNRIMILKGELVHSEQWADNTRITFKHTTQKSFLLWHGENGIQSHLYFYAVDRLNLNNQEELPIRHTKFRKTLLGRLQYQQVGQVAYNDPNYYDNSDQVNYNFDTAHSAMRMGGEGSFGSNTKMRVYPNVNIDCVTELNCEVSQFALFLQFCIKL